MCSQACSVAYGGLWVCEGISVPRSHRRPRMTTPFLSWQVWLRVPRLWCSGFPSHNLVILRMKVWSQELCKARAKVKLSSAHTNAHIPERIERARSTRSGLSLLHYGSPGPRLRPSHFRATRFRYSRANCCLLPKKRSANPSQPPEA